MLLTIFGAILGFLFCLCLQPLLQDRVNAFLASTLPPQIFRGSTSLAGTWTQLWSVANPGYPPGQPSDAPIHQFLNHVYGRFSFDGRTYQLAGKISGHFLTGHWEDIQSGHTYHGSFQLRIFPNANHMEGVWVGWGTDGTIKHGQWTWTRNGTSTA